MVAKRSPILIEERKGNPGVHLLTVIVASGIARGCVNKKATATKPGNMAAILQRHIGLVSSVLL